MINNIVKVLLLCAVSQSVLAITPTFNVIRNIHFGEVLPEPGSCRMIANTGVITGYIGQNVCLLHDSAQNGLFTIIGNPNSTIRVKLLANQDDGDGIVFNPYIYLVSQGVPTEISYNSVGFVEINSGADGIVDLYLGGDLTLSRSYSYGQTISFSFVNAIEWQEVP